MTTSAESSAPDAANHLLPPTDIALPDSGSPAPATPAPVDWTRRRLLLGGGALAAFAITGRARPALAKPRITDAAWRELNRRMAGDVLRPDDSAYAATAQPNNLLYADRLPAGIARCLRAEDVTIAVKWARENEIPLIVRGGGHNYAGYSTTRGLQIDMAGLNDVSIDEKTGVVTVGAGLRNGEVFSALRPRNVSIVHGRCSGVGVAGFFLGGGIGFNMRLHGIGSDAITGMTLVDADGTSRRLASDENADLFWACRGGAGGNFGINTAFSFTTFPVGDITVFDLDWTAKPEEMLAVLVEATAKAPRTFGAKISLHGAKAGDKHPRINLLGQIHGSRAELDDLLAPVMRIAKPTSGKIVTLPYWTGQKLLSEESTPEYYRERSRFVRRPLPSKAIEVACKFARAFPGTHSSASLKLFQTGGAVNDRASADTAFVHRDSLWLLSIAAVWERHESRASVEALHRWLNRYYEAMLPYCDGGAFQNFPDPELTDWANLYYGTNLPRLQKIKAAADPAGVFQFPQSIRPAAA